MKYFTAKTISILYLITFLKLGLAGQVDQNIRFTSITTIDGLPNNSLNAITKDDLGFVWIGTNDGLCRFEGRNSVKVFKANNPEIEGGLQSSNIRSLFLDSKNNLWIGTRLGGLTKYHQATETWTTYRNKVNDKSSLSNDEILTITEDDKGRIWVGTEVGLNAYIPETDSFISFTADSNTPGTLHANAVLSIYVDHKGWIWVGTWEGGLSLLEIPENGKLQDAKFKTFYPSEEVHSSRIWAINQDNENRYWIGTYGAGLYFMQIPSESHNTTSDVLWKPKFHNFNSSENITSITNDDVKVISQDRNNNLWVGTASGLNFLPADDLKKLPTSGISSDNYKLKFSRYPYQFNNPNSIIHDNLTTVFEDTQGIIWVGTKGGISQYNWAANQFDVHELGSYATKNLVFQNLYVDPQGDTWFGNAEKGIIKYNFEQQKVIKEINIGFKNSFVSAIHCPDNKNLYFGHTKGVGILNLQTDKIKNYSLFDENLNQDRYNVARTIYKDQRNIIWVGTDNGMFRLDEITGKYQLYTTDPENPKTIGDNSVNQIYEDSNGIIWLATNQGLNKVLNRDSDKLEFERFKHDSENPENSIASNRLNSLLEYEGILYIGSDIGLLGYDLSSRSFVNYSNESNKYGYQSLVKSDGISIWGSTTEGIVSYNLKNKSFNKYEKRDGLGDLVFHVNSSYVDKNGMVFFGSQRGITSFKPSELLMNETPPSIHVTGFRKMGPDGEVNGNAIYNDEIIVDHNEYYLSLDYTAINYNRSEKNQYAYMLEGFDNQWIQTTNKTPAIYTNLKHGEYFFKVKAANNDGVWNNKERTIKIIKDAAFWETLWFKLVSIILASCLIFLGIWYYTRNIQERNKRLQKYNDDLSSEISQRKIVEKDLQKSNANLERSNNDLEQFAYIASHDLQEPLRVVGNFIGLLKHRYKKQLDEDAFQYIDFAVDGVSRMSKQIKSILTFSRVSQNDFEFRKVNLEEVIATNLHDLSQAIDEKDVQFKIGKLPKILCDKNLITMVFHNLITNAIKFNKSKTPLITIMNETNSSNEFWQFSVKDNGIGIHKDYQEKIFEIFKRLNNKTEYTGTGIGLALCEKIIHRHGGKIWVESDEGQGTTFYFTISKNQKSILDN